LHLIGNLNHFIGAQLGNSGYIRQRELEFSLKNVPVAKLKEEIEITKELVKYALLKLKNDDLINEYPLNVFGAPMSTQYFLVHLTTHLAYHLGQINYHRRLLDN
jgi:ethanolamine utilization protein EutA (predicted chaperonin)